MNRNGFMLIEILLVIAFVALIGSGLYFKSNENGESQVQTGLNAEKRAEDVVNQINEQSLNQKNALERLNNRATSTPDKKPVLE